MHDAPFSLRFLYDKEIYSYVSELYLKQSLSKALVSLNDLHAFLALVKSPRLLTILCECALHLYVLLVPCKGLIRR